MSSSTRADAPPASTRHPVDQVPPKGKLAILSTQHVLAFYAGAVVVPRLIARGLGRAAAPTLPRLH
ncbi:MAG: hypothetical protein L0J86_02310, partial [Corynebacterium sp.]|nr:hypothetical protein [Corynebacterium sp.]